MDNDADKLNISSIQINEDEARALSEMGVTSFTEIQRKAIPPIREGKDIIGRSLTGTGKTLAFALPAIEKVVPGMEPASQVLIVCPTRELALQDAEEISRAAKYNDKAKTAVVYGGAPMDKQIAKLRKAAVVVGTPGRIMDHLRRKTLRTDNIGIIVLDEADEMLSMGFIDDVRTIMSTLRPGCQKLLFSATMPAEITALAGEFMSDPVTVEAGNGQATVDKIKQVYVNVPMGRKKDALALLLLYFDPAGAMIFCNTKKAVDEVASFLGKNGFSADGLHGDLNQSQRTRVMNAFKAGSLKILVCTDVAARGIDVTDMEYVINYDIPLHSEYYVHRIGRTGRIGRSGTALTICSGRKQTQELMEIAGLAQSVPEEISLPDRSDITARKASGFVSEIESAAGSPACADWLKAADELLASGLPARELLAAAICAHFGGSLARADNINDVFGKKSSSADTAAVKLSIGRNQHVAPAHIVSSVASAADIRGSEIGKIEIFDEHTIVGIPADLAQTVVSAMDGAKINGFTVKASIASPFDSQAAKKGRALPSSALPRSQSRQGRRHSGRSPPEIHREEALSRCFLTTKRCAD